jgi:hypothetical protein
MAHALAHAVIFPSVAKTWARLVMFTCCGVGHPPIFVNLIYAKSLPNGKVPGDECLASSALAEATPRLCI